MCGSTNLQSKTVANMLTVWCGQESFELQIQRARWNRSLRVGCPDRLLSENQFEAEISLNKSVNNSVGVFNLYHDGHATHGN
ncbi:Uncharacterized protein FWK35_00004382 [Aphis craccivora]|uniref:Uncharacterized protein n=1 Tax=Aphis craccivora TaxID=307492 RepID=A0A6G0ZS37_APHCR|nr:Uncharacterized protein FWK35_00004382 [Aphis craccivora]